jgi:hypothetical protein
MQAQLFPLPDARPTRRKAVAFYGRFETRQGQPVYLQTKRVDLPPLPYLSYRCTLDLLATLRAEGKAARARRLAVNCWQIEIAGEEGLEVYP